MEKFKNILIRFLKLRAVWTILLLISSAAGLIIIFLKGLEASLIAYIVYITAFYTLLVVAFSVPNLVRQIKSFVYGNKYGKRYVTDLPFRMRLTLLMSLVANVSYAVLQLGTGIYYASFWYGAVGIYYFVVCIVHFMILRNFQKEGRSQRKDLRVYRFCGYLLFVLTVAAFGMVIQIVCDGKGAR